MVKRSTITYILKQIMTLLIINSLVIIWIEYLILETNNLLGIFTYFSEGLSKSHLNKKYYLIYKDLSSHLITIHLSIRCKGNKDILL